MAHFGIFVSCFAAGIHDEERIVWLVLTATLAVLPLGWAVRRSHRAVKAAAGSALAVLSFGVYAWSTDQIDHRLPATVTETPLQLGTVAGIVLIVQALCRARPSPIPAATEPAP